MSHSPQPTVDPSTAVRRRKAVFASWIGTTIEYYDFSGYGLAASLIFPILFFPTSNPAVATLLSLSTFAVGYIARPVGAAVFGHYGDRIGRKNALVVTLVLMGASTFAIGLLPPIHRSASSPRPYWSLLDYSRASPSAANTVVPSS